MTAQKLVPKPDWRLSRLPYKLSNQVELQWGVLIRVNEQCKCLDVHTHTLRGFLNQDFLTEGFSRRGRKAAASTFPYRAVPQQKCPKQLMVTHPRYFSNSTQSNFVFVYLFSIPLFPNIWKNNVGTAKIPRSPQIADTLCEIPPQFYTPKLCSEYKCPPAIEITSMKSETAGSMMIKGRAL